MTAERMTEEPAAWIEHHKGGDNLVWDKSNLPCTPLYKAAPAASPEWISVDVELPDYDHIVIWYHESGNYSMWEISTTSKKLV